MPFPLAQVANPQGENLRNTIDALARTPLSEILILVTVCTVLRLALAGPLKNTPVHLRSGFYPVLKFVNEAMDAIVYAAVFVFMIIRPFALQTFLIPSGSMVSTLLVNDMIVANKWVYRTSDPKPGDIVVFRPPAWGVYPEQLGADGVPKVDFIKRCIGGPGDLVEIRKGELFRNGQKVAEPYVKYTSTMDQIRFTELPPERRDQIAQDDFKLVEQDGEVIPVHSFGPYTNSRDLVVSKYVVDPIDGETLRAKPAVKIPEGYYLMMGDNRNNSSDGRYWGLVPRESIVGKSEAIWFPFSRWQVTR